MLKSDRTWKNSRDYLRHLINVAFISISIPLLLFAWLYLEYSVDNLVPMVSEPYDGYATAGFSALILGLLVYTHTLVQKTIAAARRPDMLIDRLCGYRNALVRRYVLYSFITFLVVAGFYITANEVMIIWFAIMILAYSIQNPSLHGIVRQLRLKGEEKEQILKHAPIAGNNGEEKA